MAKAEKRMQTENPSMKQAGWTLLAVLLALIATAEANAAPVMLPKLHTSNPTTPVPSDETAPATAAVTAPSVDVSTMAVDPDLTSPVTSAPTVAAAQPANEEPAAPIPYPVSRKPQVANNNPTFSAPTTQPAVVAPAPAAKGSEAKKCDMADGERLLREAILKRIRDAKAAGEKPAISYEQAQDPGDMGGTDVRARSQADRLAKGFFAALAKSDAPADGASEAMFGDPNRRASLEVYGRCARSEQAPKKISVNQYFYVDEKSGPCGKGMLGPKPGTDISLNSTLVFQTDLSQKAVVQRLSQQQLTSGEGNQVQVCRANMATCLKSNRSYTNVDPVSLDITQGEMFFKAKTSVMKVISMTNITSMKVQTLDVCGGKVMLVSSFAVGDKDGFDRTTLLSLVGNIGGKTVALADFSAQSTEDGALPLNLAGRWQDAGDMLFGKVNPKTQMLEGGYASIANLIGSTERPVLGEIGGSPLRQPGESLVARSTRQIH